MAASSGALLGPERRIFNPFKENRTAFYRAAKNLGAEERTELGNELAAVFRDSDTAVDVRVGAFRAWCELQLAQLSIKPDTLKRQHDSFEGQVTQLRDIVTGHGREARDAYNAASDRPELPVTMVNLLAMRAELADLTKDDATRRMWPLLTTCIATAGRGKMLKRDYLRQINDIGLPDEIYALMARYTDDRSLLKLAAVSRKWAGFVHEEHNLRPAASRQASANILRKHHKPSDVASVFRRFPHVSTPQPLRGSNPYDVLMTTRAIYDGIAGLEEDALVGLRSLNANVPPDAFFEAGSLGSLRDRYSRIGDKAVVALDNVSRKGRADLTISETVAANAFESESLEHVIEIMRSPGSKVDSVHLVAECDGRAREGALAAALTVPGNTLRRLTLIKVTVVGNELMAALRDPSNRIETLEIPESCADPAAVARTLKSSENQLKAMHIGIETDNREAAVALCEALGHDNCRLEKVALNLRESITPMSGTVAQAFGTALTRAMKKPEGLNSLTLQDMPGGDIGAALSRCVLDGMISRNSQPRKLWMRSRAPTFDVQPFIDALARQEFPVEELALSHPRGAGTDGMSAEDQLQLIRAAVDSVKQGGPLKVLDLCDCPKLDGIGVRSIQNMLAELNGTGRMLKVRRAR